MEHRRRSTGFIGNHVHQNTTIVIQENAGTVLEGNPEPLARVPDEGLRQPVTGQGCGSHRVQPRVQAYDLMPALVQDKDGVLGHGQVAGQVQRKGAGTPSPVPLTQPSAGIGGQDFLNSLTICQSGRNNSALSR